MIKLDMTQEEFEKLVFKALEGLPLEFKKKLDNVDIVVEDWPTPNVAKGRLLLGLYQGIPKPKRSINYSMVLPDKITIFKGPILLISRGNQKLLKKIVAETVLHEIAHHFGISDTRLREIGS